MKNLITLLAIAIWSLSVVEMSAQNYCSDATFGTNGEVIQHYGANYNFYFKSLVQSDGKIVSTGSTQEYSSTYQVLMARHNAGGTPDLTFNGTGFATFDAGFGSNDEAYCMALYPSDKYVIGGRVDAGGNQDVMIMRVNSDGTLDNTFNGNGIFLLDVTFEDDYIYDVAVQSDGKILACGYTQTGSTQNLLIIRINADGSIDSSFDGDGIKTITMASYENKLKAIDILSDGKIIVGGFVTNTTQDLYVACLNPDGSFNTNFNAPDGYNMQSLSGYDDAIMDIQVVNDTIYAVGNYNDNPSDNNQNSQFLVVRYRVDGTLDADFNITGWNTADVNTISDNAYSLWVLDNRKVLVGGISWTDINTFKSKAGFARFNNDGSLDNTFGNSGIFSPTTSSDTTQILSIVPLSDGSFIASGAEMFNGVYDAALVKYDICPCIVNIPDANFKAALVANSAINTNADAEIQCFEASAYTGKIDVNSLSVSDLTGIEAFTSLKTLFCNINTLTNLNLSANTALDTLVCNNNQLTSLDLTSCASLKYVYCAINSLTNINASANPALDYLNCAFNSLTSLDVSNNPILTYLSCGYNSLTNLNVKNGNNVNFSSFLATSNPALTCIQVDNAAWSTANWTNIPPTASFSEFCASSISVTASITNANCYGTSTGALDITVSGGTAPYTYAWSNLSGLEDLTGLAAGEYIVNVTDAASATLVDTFTVTEPTQLFAVTTVQTNESCFGANDGSVDGSGMGGVSPYSFAWSTGETTVSVGGLTQGTYQLTVTDANGCSASTTYGIFGNSQITLSPSSVQATCGNADGSATIIPSGGVSPYSYLWSNSEITQSINGVTAGSYNVTVTDANGCSASSTVNVSNIGAPSVSIDYQTNVSCFGGNNGVAALIIFGTGPYSFLWSDGQTIQDAVNLTAGIYTVTVTDNNLCTATATTTINQPAMALTANAGSDQAICLGNNANIAVVATGGAGTYTYNWSPSATLNDASSQNPVSSTLVNELYTVTVTDANNCTATDNVQVSVTPEILVDAGADQNISSSSVTLSGSVSGGTTTGIWSSLLGDGAFVPDNTTLSAVYMLGSSDMATGFVTLYLTSTNNGICFAIIDSVVITYNGTTSLSTTFTQTNTSCFASCDGSATANVSGGTSPYNYMWSSGATAQTINGLCAGVYTVTISDSVFDEVIASITITQPTQITASTSITDVLCFGEATGSATVMASGGTTPYTYLWSNSSTSSNLSGLISGGYNVTVTDANGCFTTSSATINQPPYLSMMISSLTAESGTGNCDGAMSVYTSGGTSPFTYLWNPSVSTSDVASGLCVDDYYVTVTDANGCIATINDTVTTNVSQAPVADFVASQTTICGSGSVSFSDFSTGNPTSWNWIFGNGNTSSLQNPTAIYSTPGSYSVSLTVTNSFGSDNMIKTNYIVVAPNPVVSVTTTNVDCNGASTGSASATVSSGTFPYFYNWNVGGASTTLSNLTAGTYSVVVTDANGCMGNASGTITEPVQLIANAGNDTLICFGANAYLVATATGGNGTYLYSWSPSSTLDNANSQNPISSTFVNEMYVVTVTDVNLCTASDTVLISVNTEIIVNAGSNQNVSIPSVSLNGTISGGTTTGIWQVQGGTGSFVPDNTTLNAVYMLSSTDMLAGTLEFILRSTNNICTYADTVHITYTQPVLNITTSQSNVICYGDSTGWANVLVTGGTSPYTYNWNNGGFSATLNNLSSGIYDVTITDYYGVQGTTSVTITEPSELLLTFTSIVDETVQDSCDGAINTYVSGGTSPYYYSWSNSASSQNLTNLCAGVYTLTVTDANACTAILQDTILAGAQPCNLMASISSQTNVNCFGDSTGSATVSVSGGTSPYSYNWSNGSTTNTLYLIPSSTYTVTVSDFNSCTSTASVTITENPQIDVSAIITNVTTYAGNDGAIVVTVSGGTSPYSFSWSNGGVSASLNSLVAGIYYLTVSDDYSCQFDTSFEVTEPASIISISSVVNNVSCFGLADGIIDISVVGGQTPYSFEWSNTEATEDLYNLSAGDYIVTITDANSAILIKTFTIAEPAELTVSISSQTDVSCFGLDDGSIITNVIGGTTPYIFSWSDAQTTTDALNLMAGTYGLTVSDANFCESILNATITESDEILLTSSITDVSCGGTSDGAIDISVTGGIGTYTFVWSNSSNTEDLANLAVGNYSVTVIDGNLCEFTTDFNVSSGANIIVTDSVENVSCYGANDGSISLDISGGNPPYNINWSNGSTSNILSGLAPGTYSVTISDGFPCSRTITFTINQPLTDITASSVSTTVADCNYSCTGSATLTISGGTSPYTYLWSGGQTSNPSENMCPGMNTVTITDSNGCFKQYSVQINIEPLSKIRGNIYYSGILMPVDSAIVELWKETSSNNSGKTKVGDLHNVSNGYYEFSGLPSGTYFVKAKVISQGDFPNTLPTWYDTARQWFNATPIVLACNVTQNININMLQVPAMANGNTDIHGKVTTATTNKSILGEPIPGAEITLEQEPDDEPIISTSSGNDGTYDFLDIPSASYIVVVDIPGYTQFETYNITVNPSDTSINNLNFVVDTNDVGLGIYIDHTIFVPLVNGKFMEVNVYPNPFTENVSIEFTLEESANVSVDIIDALGKNVANVCNESQSKGKHTFDFNDKLQAGIYFVKISVDSTVYVKKLVKK